MPPKRKATTTKTDKPEHEIKKQRLSKALTKAKRANNELPGEIDPDAECPIKGLTVYINREKRTAYDVMLNQSNIAQNNNKYYLLQVLQDKLSPKDDNYVFWSRWGRVGYKGQTFFTVSNLDNAIQSFEKKFKDKTGNDFGRAKFEPRIGKYDHIKLDYSKSKLKSEPKSDKKVEIKTQDSESIPSKLDPNVKATVDLICDMTKIELFLKTQMNYDANKAPLGRISKAQIKLGFQVLSKIEKKLLVYDFDTDFRQLVNEYYTKVPHDFGFRRPRLLQTMDEFKEELALLEALSDIEVTNAALKEEKGPDPMNPSDRKYEKLRCSMKVVRKDSATYKMIETYMKNTQGSTHNVNLVLHNVFEVERENEAAGYSTYTKNIANRRLLWHGSGIANWFGILSQGLRIAPPEAPVSGYMFGKGVYFADCCSKSANYCRASFNQRSFMALAEVALGKCHELKESDCNASLLPNGCHSTHGVGRSYPDAKVKKTIKLDKNNVSVPMGEIVERKKDDYTLQYNEFIVYNTQQIRLRYLLEVEFLRRQP